MPRVYRAKFWQVEVPDTWKIDGTNQGAMLFKPDGVGTLMVFPSQGAAPSEAFAHEHFSGRLLGTVRTSEGGGNFRRIWALTCRGETLLAHYQCALKNAEAEIPEVDQIVRSISEVTDE